MIRPRVQYATRRAAVAAAGISYDSATPTAGFYSLRLVKGGFPAGIRIWFGPPFDPVDGSELDRHWRWQATANGAPIDLDRVWPKCGNDPIDEAEHDYLVATQAHAALWAPDSPQADPLRRIDLLTAPIPIF